MGVACPEQRPERPLHPRHQGHLTGDSLLPRPGSRDHPQFCFQAKEWNSELKALEHIWEPLLDVRSFLV